MRQTQQDWQTRAKDMDEETGPMAGQRLSLALTANTKSLLRPIHS